MVTIICICNDVTLEEVKRAVEEGLADLENIKRRLRLGMGPCGGKYCVSLLLRMLPTIAKTSARYRGADELRVPRSRPPLKPIKLGLFEGEGT